ncbi:DUF6776 family protein [Pseudomonas oryzae]|uniref:Uncharacterized protein n=1 Tax=Pseudomonas oryzae TaxID=1392877 RepID=A0A1H1WYV9_9PSED|nr:DUF6776 family protein [Pseudomonas oryzae]SDT02338.1 hypothetical protein SAMN05216221_3252 [Pseudomonas oryzae]
MDLPGGVTLSRRGRRVVPVALLLALPVAYLAGYWHSEHRLAGVIDQARVQAEQLQLRSAELDRLRRQQAVMESGASLAQQAEEQNRQTIKLLEEQIFRLQQELATYQDVVAPAGKREGLQIRSLELQATEEPGRFRFRILLGRIGSDAQPLRGSLQVELRGRLKGRASVLALGELGNGSAGELPFAFRHFQAVPEGADLAELRLPDGFEPQEVRIRAAVEGQHQPLERQFRWAELQ